MSLVKLAQLLVVMCAVTLTRTAPGAAEDSKLQFLSLSPQQLQVVYRQNAQEAILMSSEVTDHHHQVSIATLEGEPLVSVTSDPSGSSLLWKILGYNILLHNSAADGEQAQVMEFTLPLITAEHVEKNIKHSLINQLVHALDSDTSSEIKQAAFRKLFARTELQSIEAAALAVGAAGVKGHDNAAALNLYSVVMNLARLQNSPEMMSYQPIQEVADNERDQPRRINKRATCSRPGFWWWQTLYERGCSRCPIGSGCTGMCGKTCSCWSWVCGDCCYHQGCYDHDHCCNVNGLFHHTCLWVVPFECSGYRHRC